MLPPIFTTIGTFLVYRKERFYITKIGGENSSCWFTGMYVIDNKQEENIFKTDVVFYPNFMEHHPGLTKTAV